MEVTSQIHQQIKDDIKQAMKNKDSAKRDVLRSLDSEIKNAQIENNQQPLTDDQVIAVLSRIEKKRNDSIAQYQEAEREDLVAAEREELSVVQEYLPKKLSAEELREVVNRVKEEQGLKEFGSLMKAVMTEVKGQADGNQVKQIVNQVLS